MPAGIIPPSEPAWCDRYQQLSHTFSPSNHSNIYYWTHVAVKSANQSVNASPALPFHMW